jgi:hypothetical protein
MTCVILNVNRNTSQIDREHLLCVSEVDEVMRTKWLCLSSSYLMNDVS